MLVTTDLFHRGLDFKSVNVVINYDMPISKESYLHRIGRAGRFGTKGLAISLCTKDDEKVLEEVQKFFLNGIKELPTELETITNMLK